MSMGNIQKFFISLKKEEKWYYEKSFERIVRFIFIIRLE